MIVIVPTATKTVQFDVNLKTPKTKFYNLCLSSECENGNASRTTSVRTVP